MERPGARPTLHEENALLRCGQHAMTTAQQAADQATFRGLRAQRTSMFVPLQRKLRRPGSTRHVAIRRHRFEPWLEPDVESRSRFFAHRWPSCMRFAESMLVRSTAMRHSAATCVS
ncbi:hypothetical protein A7982_13501 [Minicystis rosea]|nr:hypothetical protein A7982_13501 [Minicystis rosea]